MTGKIKTKARLSAQSDLTRILRPTGGEEGETIDINSVEKVPDTIPKGKEVLLEGEEVENQQTPLFACGLD